MKTVLTLFLVTALGTVCAAHAPLTTRRNFPLSEAVTAGSSAGTSASVRKPLTSGMSDASALAFHAARSAAVM